MMWNSVNALLTDPGPEAFTSEMLLSVPGTVRVAYDNISAVLEMVKTMPEKPVRSLFAAITRQYPARLTLTSTERLPEKRFYFKGFQSWTKAEQTHVLTMLSRGFGGKFSDLTGVR
jgi:hypothetical protein